MANAIYPEYKEFLLGASANVSLNVNDATDGPFVALVDTGAYTYSTAHDFYNDLSGVVGTDQRIVTPTIANGTFDGDNCTFTAVSGNSIEALVIYRHNSGANTTWKLVAFIDTSVTGLPVTPNGGDITITWNASGIFTL
jgi:activator of HSP90 ATPase